MRLRVLTWNLFHGRARPGAGRDLLGEFSDALAGWEWDVALLQEVPPWWPVPLAAALGCERRFILTSRNALGVVGQRLAVRYPDALKSWGGGCNAILCRSDRVAACRSVRLCRRPERRWAIGVELGCGAWVVTLHASLGSSSSDAAARRDVASAGMAARRWAAGRALVLAGDCNVRTGLAVEGFTVVGSSDVDHVLVAGGASACGAAVVLDSGALSDHVPLALTVELPR